VTDNDPVWVSAGAVARALEVDRHTVARLAQRGRIPSARRGLNGRWRFDAGEVARWAAAKAAREGKVTA
jgi:excisionase family DNA binding protein